MITPIVIDEELLDDEPLYNKETLVAERLVTSLSPPPIDQPPADKQCYHSFWQQWQEAQQGIRQQCARALRYHADHVDEAMSRIMVRACESFSEQGGKIDHFHAWVAKITHHVVIDLYRERRRQALRWCSFTETQAQEVFTPSADPVDLYAAREQVAQITERIIRLPAKLREVATRHFMQGMSISDIAECLSLSHDNTRKRIQLARQALRATDLPLVAFPASALQNQPDESLNHQITHIDTACDYLLVEESSGIQRFILCTFSRRESRLDQRCRALIRYLSRHTSGWKKRLQLAELYFASAQWNSAAMHYMTALEQDCPIACERQHIFLRLIQISSCLNNTQRTNELAEQAHRYCRDDAERTYVSGIAALSRHDLGEAIRLFQDAARLAPAIGRYAIQLARTLAVAGRTSEAVGRLRQVLAVEPGNLLALHVGLEVLGELGHVRERVMWAQRLLVHDPKNPVALTILGTERIDRGLVNGSDGQETVALLRRSLHATTPLPESHAAMAAYHIARGECSQALRYANNLTTIYKNCPASWATRALILHSLNAAVEAWQAIVKAVRLDPADPYVKRAAQRWSSPSKPSKIRAIPVPSTATWQRQGAVG
jgi:RNA polymerase sigma factor (sigma-70 family)